MSSTVMEQQSPRETIRARLLAERKRIFAEIEAYPAPITACDAQFNHLLEQRARIAEELARLEARQGGSRGAREFSDRT